MLRQIRPFQSNLISISYCFKLQKISHENRSKLALCVLGKIAEFCVLAEEMLYFS